MSGGEYATRTCPRRIVLRTPEVLDVIACYSHTDHGRLSTSYADAPLVLVTALSAVDGGRAHRAREVEERERVKAEARARR